MNIHFCNNSYKKQLRFIWEKCFEDIKEFVDYYFENRIFLNRVVALSEEDNILSSLHLNKYNVIYNNKGYNISYIIGVATLEKYRNKGYMRKVIEWSLQQLYREGEVFSLLMPIDSRIYERFGFGFIQDNLEIELDINTITTKKTNIEPIVVTKDNVNILKNLYDGYYKDFDLYKNRTIEELLIFIKEVNSENGNILIFDKDIVVIYETDENILIREIFFKSNKSLLNIIEHIKNRYTSKKVIINTFENDSLKYLIPYTKSNIIKIKPFMMARIINCKRFLEDSLILNGEELNIRVKDNIINENNNTYKINDRKVVLTDDDYDISIDILYLVQLLFGYKSIDDLIKLEQMEIRQKRELLERLIKKNCYFNELV
jgi:predicted acetyltransferase